MNKLEPVIAFLDERIKSLHGRSRTTALLDREIASRIDECEMIKTLCRGLIEQDRLIDRAIFGTKEAA